MRCPVHNVETVIRCGKCETPVCPKCSVIGPAGIRCRDCAALRSSHLYQVDPSRLALGVLASLAVGVAGGYALALFFRFGFFLLWGGLLLGGAVGEVLLRVMGRKRGTTMEMTAGVCAGLGVLAGLAAWFLANGFIPSLPAIIAFMQRNPFYFFAMGIAVFSAVSRIRFL